MRFAVVVMLPDETPGRSDFASREFDTWEEFATMMEDVEAKVPKWQLVSVCHLEDLPLLMEPPSDATA